MNDIGLPYYKNIFDQISFSIKYFLFIIIIIIIINRHITSKGTIQKEQHNLTDKPTPDTAQTRA